MEKRYNLSNLEALFKDYLITANKSKVSIKNYVCDLRHFLSWFMFSRIESSSIQTHLDIFVNTVEVSAIEDYISYQKGHNLPVNTINRRLSSLRSFFAFCEKRGFLESNPSKDVKNLEIIKHKTNVQLIDEAEKASRQEVAEDLLLRDFITFAEKKGKNADGLIMEEFKQYVN